MKLSIIVTIYNREKTLRRCVDSLLQQDMDEYEILLVDDGSTDGSRKIVEEYMIQVPERIRGIFQKNGGVASARNAGLAAAAGTYITYVDSDDWLESNCLGRLYQVMEKSGYDILLFDAWECFPDGEKRRFPPFYDIMQGVKQGTIRPEEYLLARPCPWNQWTKRSVWEAAFAEEICPRRAFPGQVFPQGKLYEDLGTLPILAVAAEKIGYLEEACYWYYQSEGSIMRAAEYRPGFDDIFDVVKMLKERLGDEYPLEISYLWYEHLLISGGKRYLDCGRRDLARKVAEEIRKEYPNWSANPYVSWESRSKRLLARLLYEEKFTRLRFLQRIKRALSV